MVLHGEPCGLHHSHRGESPVVARGGSPHSDSGIGEHRRHLWGEARHVVKAHPPVGMFLVESFHGLERVLHGAVVLVIAHQLE